MSEIEKVKILYQCTSCGNPYETMEEAEACWERDSMNIPVFVEERVESIGEIFPTEILLKRIEGNKIVEIAEYERKNIQKVSINVE